MACFTSLLMFESSMQWSLQGCSAPHKTIFTLIGSLTMAFVASSAECVQDDINKSMKK